MARRSSGGRVNAQDTRSAFADESAAAMGAAYPGIWYAVMDGTQLTRLCCNVSPDGVLLMLIYWMAHLDWPFVENKNNLLFDYHLVYGGVLIYLIAKRAGHVFRLDGLLARIPLHAQYPTLRLPTS
jgi:hypothetical protein